jgi:hypothetical protein
MVERRKLAKIVNCPEQVSLTLAELRAIDRYLEPFGEGLARNPIFEKPDILQSIAATGDILFLLGAKPDEEPYFSLWDVISMAEIQRRLYFYSRSIHLDLHYVQLSTPDTVTQGVRPAMIESCAEHLEGRRSVVCIGSPRANHATEVMLARMFGVEPFKQTAVHHPRVPFHFVWAEPLPLDSAFAVPAAEIAEVDAGVADLASRDGCRALRVERQAFLAELPAGSSYTSYAITAVQRRPNGAVWVVISGISGPSTYAAARALASLAAALPGPVAGKASPILWAAVTATVDVSGRGPRRLRRNGILGDVHWTPAAEPAASTDPSERPTRTH